MPKNNNEQEEPKHKRKKGKKIKKPFVIEYRILGPFAGRNKDKWHTWARYETENDREQALKKLRVNQENGIFAKSSTKWEYRIAEDNDE